MNVALYARGSPGEKGEGFRRQLRALRYYARLHKLTVTEEHFDECGVDDDRFRACWREVLANAALRQFDAILIWKSSIAFGSIGEFLRVDEALKSAGVRLYSVCEYGVDTDALPPSQQILLRNTAASFSAAEADAERLYVQEETIR